MCGLQYTKAASMQLRRRMWTDAGVDVSMDVRTHMPV